MATAEQLRAEKQSSGPVDADEAAVSSGRSSSGGGSVSGVSDNGTDSMGGYELGSDDGGSQSDGGALTNAHELMSIFCGIDFNQYLWFSYSSCVPVQWCCCD